MKIYFEKPPGRRLVLDWPIPPRVGDDVDLTQDDSTSEPEYSDGFSGTVKVVVWWRDGNVRVVLR